MFSAQSYLPMFKTASSLRQELKLSSLLSE